MKNLKPLIETIEYERRIVLEHENERNEKRSRF